MTESEIETALDAKLDDLKAFAEKHNQPAIIAAGDFHVIGGELMCLMNMVCNIIDSVAEEKGERASILALTIALAVTGRELRAGESDAERGRAAAEYLRERLDIFSKNLEE